MKLPTPKMTIWTYRYSDSMRWNGMIWRSQKGTARIKIDNIIPSSSNMEPQQETAVRQRILFNFWRKLGAA